VNATAGKRWRNDVFVSDTWRLITLIVLIFQVQGEAKVGNVFVTDTQRLIIQVVWIFHCSVTDVKQG
jgi:hypothetical protein